MSEMQNDTIIPPSLLEAYRATAYIVNELTSPIRIGDLSLEVDAFCKEQGEESWLFITAWNPRSQILTSIENCSRMKELRSILTGYGLACFEGEGRGEGDWEPEHSFFVPGASREQSIALGKQFDQYAVVFGESGKQAELLEIPLSQ